MKATKSLIESIPADATVFYSNRASPFENFTSTWAEQCEIIGFADQFIGAPIITSVDGGQYDGADLRDSASGKTIYSITLEEGEFSDAEGGCAAERMEILWSK